MNETKICESIPLTNWTDIFTVLKKKMKKKIGVIRLITFDFLMKSKFLGWNECNKCVRYSAYGSEAAMIRMFGFLYIGWSIDFLVGWSISLSIVAFTCKNAKAVKQMKYADDTS